MQYSLEDLNNDLLNINIELTPQEIVWLKNKYGDELAEKFMKKRKIKKYIWLMMQNNNVLKASILEQRSLKKQAIKEAKINQEYKKKLYYPKSRYQDNEISR